jgi:hypothetical protein
MRDFWSTDDLIDTPFFRKVMSRDRFFAILKMLHFSNAEQSGDELNKIRFVVDFLRRKFKNVFQPFKDLCIDESLMLWKGRLSFKQYIPSKRHRFGIKLFILCDVETKFIVDFIVYTGSETEINHIPNLGISGSVVSTLLSDFLNKGHTLFCDNWYTSPELFAFLHENKTGACGTVRPNRKGMPADFPTKMKTGDSFSRHTDEMLAVKFFDKRDVHMLSTVHLDEIVSSDKINYKTGELKLKHISVMEYKDKMGAIDTTDMQISSVECARKSIKWYKKFFMHLLDVTMLNAMYLYQVQSGKKPQMLDFRLQVIRQLIEKYSLPRLNPRGGRPSIHESPLRLTERHFPAPVPQTASQGSRTQRRCHVCQHTKKRESKRKDTRFMCVQCDVALCVDPCFREYHTLLHF